ncbi:MAG: SLC13 family permease [Saprospirales bacterium]|nr:MAG: SLC13 family permease [Saprospirales bacterium]
MAENFEAWFCLFVLLLVVVFLLLDRYKPSSVFFTAILIFLITGILSIESLLLGFSNKSIITIFLLILVTALLSKTFGLVLYLDKIFGSARSLRTMILRMSASVGSVSALMNNTPIVALMIPYVYRWSKNNKKPPSRLLIPLSFSAIVGGMMTPIGTSTNLILIGFILTTGHPELTFGHFLLPGIIVFAVAIIFLTLASGYLLPDYRDIMDETKENIREYLTETYVKDDSEQIGKTIQEAELRNLEGIFLAEIHREDKTIIKPVKPEERIQKNDRLYFAGDTRGVIKLVKDNQNLEWVESGKFAEDYEPELVEVVIPFNSGLSGKTLKQTLFRETYDAAVIGIHRKGAKLGGKLGEILLMPGDLLLLTTGPDFERLSSKNQDFYTISVIEDQEKIPTWKKISLGMLTVGSIAMVFTGVIDLFVALITIFTGGLLLSLLSEEETKKNLSLDLFVILGSALTLGMVFIQTGGASLITQPLVSILSGAPGLIILVCIFLATLFFTSFITNAAAISIMFPLVYQLIEDLGLNPTPAYLTLAFSASAAFLTAVSYQTNLMVLGPGNYKALDFLKIGIPFTFVYTTVIIAFIYVYYPIYV